MSAAAGTVIATSKQIAGDIAANAGKTQQAAQAVLDNQNSTAGQKEQAILILNQAKQAQTDWGTGGDNSRALAVVTGILVGGVAGQGGTQLAANASAPYAAAAIGDYFKTKGNENQTLQDLSHAVLGATLAYANGASAVGGALAGGGAELAAQILTKQLYPDAFDANGKLQRDKLTPAQAANITALSSGIGALLSGVAGGTVLDAAVGGKVATNAVENNFLKHADASAMKKEFDQCSKKPGGCSDADYVNIRNKFLAVSRTNIAQVESCIQSGNVKCVSDLEGQAASRGEISTQLVGADYTIFTGKQDNVNLYGTVKGTASLFGSDVLQAQDIAKFRQSNCSGVSASACDGMVKEALNDRLARVGILTVAGMATPLAVNGMRGLRLPGGKGNATNGVQSSGAAANELYGADGKLIGVIDAATGKIATGQQIGSNAQPPRLSVSTGANWGVVNLAETQATLTTQVADLRATLTGNAKTGGNMGVAQIDIPGIQSTMAASSQVDLPSAAQAASGFVGKVPETFPSSVVPTGGAKPFPLLRDVDSEAKILNNVAAKLGDNTSTTGTINLLTERSPCASCSNVIDLFKAKYPNITVNVFDNNGKLIPPTKKGP